LQNIFSAPIKKELWFYNDLKVKVNFVAKTADRCRVLIYCDDNVASIWS